MVSSDASTSRRTSGARTAIILGLFIAAGSATGLVVASANQVPDPTPVALAVAPIGASPTPAPRVITRTAATGTAPSASAPVVAATDASSKPTPKLTPKPKPETPSKTSAKPAAKPDPIRAPAVSTASAPKKVALKYATPDVPKAARIGTFKVKGSTPRALIASVKREAQKHCEGKDTLACVHLNWHATWKKVTDRSGACTITDVEISHSDIVELPRWTSPSRVDPRLLKWWKAVIKHLAWHESQHIAVEVAFLPKIAAALEGAPCAKGHDIVRAYGAKGAKRQAAFDVRDAKDWDLPKFPLR